MRTTFDRIKVWLVWRVWNDKGLGEQLDTRVFQTEDAALHWIRNQPEQMRWNIRELEWEEPL